MKLEVGMYVRTKKGIAKIKTLDDLDNVAWTDNKDIYFGIIRESGKLNFKVYDDGTVIGKPSHNIIDLIEVGDYVNGIRIDNFSGNRFTGAKAVTSNLLENKIGSKCYFFEEKDIETIVTKEQMEAIQYKVV